MIEIIEEPCTSRQALAQDCVRTTEDSSSSEESDFQLQEVVTQENKDTEQAVDIEIEEEKESMHEQDELVNQEEFNKPDQQSFNSETKLQRKMQEQDQVNQDDSKNKTDLQQEQGEIENQEDFTKQSVTLNDRIEVEDFAQIEAYLETVKPIEEKPVNFKSVFTIFHDQDQQSVEDDSDEETQSESSNIENDFTDNAFLSVMDKSETIKVSCQEVGEGDFTVQVKTKEELQCVLTGNKTIERSEKEEDQDYRQLLKWDIKLPEQNRMILKPIERKKKPDQNNTNDICQMIVQTKQQKDKPEFEVQLPQNSVEEEGDKIIYPQNITADPNISNTLELSKNHVIVFEQKEELDNSTIVSKTIAEVRQGIREFNETFEEFKQKSRIAREQLLKDYNDAVEQEIKIVDKFMSLQQPTPRKTFQSKLPKRIIKPGEEIPEEYLRKHFEDMGMCLPEDMEGPIRKKLAQPQPVELHQSENVETGRRFLEQLEDLKKMVEEDEKKKPLEENAICNKVSVVHRNVKCSLEMQLAQENLPQ